MRSAALGRLGAFRGVQSLVASRRTPTAHSTAGSVPAIGSHLTKAASAPYRIVNFYHLVQLTDPDAVVAQHREQLEGKDIRGRIYFSAQGVNAQFTGTVDETDDYLHWMQQRAAFKGMQWNGDGVDQHMFPKLRLKHKPNLVQLHGGTAALPITQPTQRAEPLTPAEWKAKLSETVVLDVRNGYEWDAGHFKGAARPKEDAFNETPTEERLPLPLQSATKDTPILMYCTGGIRCDIYSTVLRQKGFENLYSLQGGVQRYFKEEGNAMWEGSLFVFDGRMAIHPDTEAAMLPSSIRCQVCNGEGVVPHVNCANVDCNRLFVACGDCKERLGGCCCQECMEAPRLLRPARDGGGYYGKFGVYAMDRFKRSVTAATERQIARRERRVERTRAKRHAAKSKRCALRRRPAESRITA